ncbi:PrgI family protein [Subdoligranulum sp. DSM 109015]|uniref:PrgI family protein n=1 Tax=Gemmiger gallinarum TaxID=2779354 RepID=A0ABR9R5L1_9FIRM|nr:PrgI family protein [Gemmiger gallinarum]MBE5038416.1 PrgI family protein [Gemmiger gallinarum]
MQVNINKDFQRYEEDVFMGLSLRQLLWSGASVAIAITVYFGLQPVLGQETVSWICIVAAAPFAMAGFFQYDQMTIWQFLKAAFVTEFLRSGPRVWVAENRFEAVLHPQKKKRQFWKRKEKRKP